MKLTTQQIDEIREFLDGQHLNFQEFYDEMLDHLILETEARMTDSGQHFDQAFWGIIDQLNCDYYVPFDFMLSGASLRGIKVLERKSYGPRNREGILKFGNLVLKNLSNPLWFVPLIILLCIASEFNQEFVFQKDFDFGVGFIGGASFGFVIQLFQGIPLSDLLLRRGFMGWIIIQERIDKLKSLEVNIAWKCILFGIGLFGVTIMVLNFMERYTIFGLSLALFTDALFLFSAIQLLFIEKHKLKTA